MRTADNDDIGALEESAGPPRTFVGWAADCVGGQDEEVAWLHLVEIGPATVDNAHVDVINLE
ncbi:MAG: hypothetical protein GY929_19905 [Actinomycetia bacterium]|nr:hypothetical protein [Actinomycetes bacterium]